MSECVVLVPGVGFHGFELRLLARRLRRAGYETRIFRHASGRRALPESAEDLHALTRSLEAEVVHFVAHSLGGRIVLQMFADHPDQRPGRIVFLGTPLCAPRAAQGVQKLPGGPWLLGTGVLDACSVELPPLPSLPPRDIGAIAGELNVVAGWLLGLPQENDTLICVAETRHPDLTDHVVLPVSHGALLLSPRVAQLVARFLRTGSFGHQNGK